MNKAYFSVGEEVILQSKSSPHFNGEHIVRQVVQDGDKHHCRISGLTFVSWEKGVGYILEDIIPKGYNGFEESLSGLTVEVLWDESALRKKHKPSELSFDSLMSSLSTPLETQLTNSIENNDKIEN